MAKKLTYEYVKKFFEDNGCELLEDHYKGNNFKMRYKCVCGRVSFTTLRTFRAGSRCRDCYKDRLKLRQEQVKEIFNEHGCVLLENEYVNNSTKMKFKCKCGNIAYSTVSNISKGHLCSLCRGNKLRKSYDEVKKEFEKRGFVLLSKEYKNNRQSLQCLCSCGRITFMSLANLIKGRECYYCGIKKMSGENHPKWNPNLTSEDREYERKIEGYADWRMYVYERDSFTCVICGDVRGRNSGGINAHHLDGYNWCINLRTDITNGVTLCEACHKDFHSVYGYGNNTREQFNEWVRTKQKRGA